MESNRNVIPKLREKEFKARNSFLTDLFDTKQGSAIYSFVVNIVILLSISTIGTELLRIDSDRLIINCFLWSFKNFDKALLIWVCIFSSTLVAYKAFCFWALLRSKITWICTCWDILWIIIFVFYFILMLIAVPIFLLKVNTKSASNFFVTIEQIRLLMKVYAFVRSNVPRIKQDELQFDQKVIVPNFKQFVYYLFAPTFVYKDSYPRSEKIRYTFIIYRFLEVTICIYIWTLLASNYYYPFYFKFGSKPYTWQSVIMLMLTSLLAGPVIVFTIFFMVLHSWQNAFAEMLRFADRQFYMDWWTTKDYGNFFRFWNTVVHDFLYTYIYKDLYETVFPGKKGLSMLLVFAISSCFHEYTIMFSLGFCLPFLFLFFWSAIFFAMCKEYTNFIQGNVFILWSHTFGNALLASLYCIEYFARMNCPKEDTSFSDFFVPRLITCNLLES